MLPGLIQLAGDNVLVGVALVASYLPVRRVLRAGPARALRAEVKRRANVTGDNDYGYQIPKSLEALVRRKVEEGHYSTEAEVVADALRLMQARDKVAEIKRAHSRTRSIAATKTPPREG